jgi:competence protein ComEC
MRHRPLLVWTLAFIAGVALEGFAGVAALVGICGLLILLQLFFFAARHRFGTRFGVLRSKAIAAAVGITLLGAASGALRYAVSQVIPNSDISRWAARPTQAIVTGTIASDPEVVQNRVLLFLRVESVEAGFRRSRASGLAAVAVPSNDATVLQYDDPVTVDGRLQQAPDATNPGEFSWRDYLARRGVRCEIVAKWPGALKVVTEPGRPLSIPGILYRARSRMIRAVDTDLSPPQASVLVGILFGQRTSIPAALTADFTETGAVHILATAGLHVGILSFWILWGLHKLTVPRKAALGVVILFLWAYAEIAGERPAVVRAVLMVTLYFAALMIEREPDAVTSVAVAALVILLFQPAQLFDPSFELSFFTVTTLVIAMPAWTAFWTERLDRGRSASWWGSKVSFWTLELAGVCLFAQLGAAPIVALAFNQVSLVGPLANLVVVPCLFVVIPLGIAGAALGGLWPVAGSPLLKLAGLGVAAVLFTVRRFGDLSWAYEAVPSPPVWTLVVYYALIWLAAGIARRRICDEWGGHGFSDRT